VTLSRAEALQCHFTKQLINIGQNRTHAPHTHTHTHARLAVHRLLAFLVFSMYTFYRSVNNCMTMFVLYMSLRVALLAATSFERMMSRCMYCGIFNELMPVCTNKCARWVVCHGNALYSPTDSPITNYTWRCSWAGSLAFTDLGTLIWSIVLVIAVPL
jgi:hypothetical protein